MNAGKMKKIELWGSTRVKNELGKWEEQPNKIKDIGAMIIPQTGRMSRQQGIETIISKCTTKIVVRYISGKDIKPDMWFKYGDHRFDILYILNPYMANKTIEIFCEERV
ncbi:head-tail adaptor protein [Marinicrinis sediminis]|uniref:Head-tail adaptor protein n=1 Tax=Marinicrinis sediminis TaxID=1652465 RepID=A0ABW5RCM5_9BACL